MHERKKASGWHQYKAQLKRQVLLDAETLGYAISPTCSQWNQGKERRGELDSQKSSQGMRLRSGCEVIGLGARVAKIKQVCSVTTRGGEKERERKSAERERETEREREGGRGGAERPDNWWRARLLFCCEKRGRGKKSRGSGYRGAGWKEGGGKSQFWESPSLWHLVMKGPVENVHYLFFPLFLSASNTLFEMIESL